MDDDMKGLDTNKWLKAQSVDCSRGAFIEGLCAPIIDTMPKMWY